MLGGFSIYDNLCRVDLIFTIIFVGGDDLISMIIYVGWI